MATQPPAGSADEFVRRAITARRLGRQRRPRDMRPSVRAESAGVQAGGIAPALMARVLAQVNEVVAAVNAADAAFSRAWDRDASLRAAEVPVRIGILISVLDDVIMVPGPVGWISRAGRVRSSAIRAARNSEQAAKDINAAMMGKRSLHSVPEEWLRRWVADDLAVRVDSAKHALAATHRDVCAVQVEALELARIIPRPSRGLSVIVLRVAASILPRGTRENWLEEWYGELATLTRAGRTRFTLQLLAGMPRLSSVLRFGVGGVRAR